MLGTKLKYGVKDKGQFRNLSKIKYRPIGLRLYSTRWT